MKLSATATECGQPGHLYPENPADQAALVAGLGSGAFWAAHMVGRCAEHAPSEFPAAYFAAQAVPCDWLPESDATCTICGGPLDQALIGAGFTDHGEVA